MNVFIVDDEIVIRESLRSCSLWDGSDFKLVGEASDGELALAMMQDVKPDIVITDIKMPFMDGIEFSRQVKTIMPWVYIVILSGYDDFSYAQQTMALGAVDYLLKPVDEAELLPTLKKIKERYERERREEKNIDELLAHEKESLPLRREHLMQVLIENKPPLPAHQALEEARLLRMDLNAKHYMTAIVLPMYSESRLSEYAQVTAVLRRNAVASGGTISVCEIGGWPVALVLGDQQEDLEERSYGFAQAVQFELVQICGLQAHVCIGISVDSIARIGESFQAAQSIARLMPLSSGSGSPQGHIAGVSDLLPVMPIHLTDFAADASIDEQLQYVPAQEVQQLLDRHIQAIGPSALQSRVMGNYIYMQLLMAVSRLIKNHGGDVKRVLPSYLQEEHSIAALGAQEIYPRLLELLETAITYRDEQSVCRYNAATHKALQYIQSNYQSLDINMREVAKYVTLSSSHFCTVFSQDLGQTFTEYLTNVRMDKAKELLSTTDMLAQDIAAKVGYNDRHYFSYLFKKVAGVSPMEYRKNSCV